MIEKLKVGVNWQELHHDAEKSVVAGLKALGFFNGDDDVETLWNKRVSYYFFPHGLGHYIGTYVHDLKGDPNLEDKKEIVPKQNLRFARPLEEGMCVTVEPGIYFIDRLLNQAKNDSSLSTLFNWETIESYQKEIHAVRVEDMIYVKKDGCEILSDHLPRTTS